MPTLIPLAHTKSRSKKTPAVINTMYVDKHLLTQSINSKSSYNKADINTAREIIREQLNLVKALQNK
jgi:hypothetical protein